MQQRSEETRTHILQSSLALFSKNGYDATGVAEICHAAGVSKGAFYHHFPSKQAVFQALLEQWLAGLNTRMDTLLAAAPDVPAGLVGMAEMAGPVFKDAANQLPMFLEFWTQSSRDPALWETAIAPYRHFQELFTGVVQAGISQGALRPVDPQAAARTLVAVAIGITLQGVMDPHGAAWDQVARQAIQLTLEGLLRRES